MKDPFEETTDEAQAGAHDYSEGPPIGTATVEVKPVLSGVEVFQGEHVVTLKGGSGYDAPWYVIHASGLDELEELFGGSDSNRVARLLERIQQAGKHFVKLGGGSAAPQRAASAPPQGATEAPSWMPAPPAPDWVYKSGFKNGKTWHAWAPAEKGGGDWVFHRAP